ncbi:MAG: hypothetical protein P0Y55_08045 [Candidatus Cohnella colombiensis]|uniref:Uncharacterized protein n=1 Tax=Candidatus Cohnella colombiensis TaxID=3121368 RepID=A0AA95JD65_9BACL|nr:MAG: hypothetical protein P0Y55_08045 [Cohnella sp.]
MNQSWYNVVGILLIAIPLIAARERRWWSCGIYAIGSFMFLRELLRGKDGWDDLADFAMLIVIVIPLYIIGTVVWIAMYYYDKKKGEGS